ncbi:MAG TPA: hypothetical protein VGU02_09240 [Gaiellaceae bacterium]|nr:hypothetical protein [Gaiellaceae bacterium]
MIALALVAVALAGCPHDPTLGSAQFARAGLVHNVSLATCVDRTIGKPRPRAAPVRTARYIATVRATGHGKTAKQVIWVTDLRTHRRRPVFTVSEYYKVVSWAHGPIILLAIGGGTVFFAIDPDGSASIAADGLPLHEVPVAGGRTRTLGMMLPYPDYVTWCGGHLVWIEGRDRVAIHAKQLVASAPPDWRPHPLVADRSLSFSTPACSPDATAVAVLAQHSSVDAGFFHTRWQLWRVGLDGTRSVLDVPPPGFADESPVWARASDALLFVRERNGYGRLMLWSTGKVRGPIANLGYSLGYYGHHDWGVAWSA